MTQTQEVTVSYNIIPPPSSPHPPNLKSAETLNYSLATTSSSTPEDQLKSLETVLGRARDDLNDKLTEWKNVIGSSEAKASKKKARKDEDDEDEDEDEE